METASNKSQSLLKIWNSEHFFPSEGKKKNYHPSYRNELRRTLQQNLEKELTGEEDTKLLEEFRSTFEWETIINLITYWKKNVGGDFQSIIGSAEEATDYLNGNKEPKQPSYAREVEGGEYYTGDYEKEVRISVRNFRLKEKKSEYSVSFVVELSEGADALQEILNTAFQSPIQKLELVPIVS